jgi:hypothetical protein
MEDGYTTPPTAACAWAQCIKKKKIVKLGKKIVYLG